MSCKIFCIGGSNYVWNPCNNIQIVHMQYTSSKVRESRKVLHNFHHSFYKYFVNIEEQLENVNVYHVLIIFSLKRPIFLRKVCNLFHFLDYPYNIFHSDGQKYPGFQGRKAKLPTAIIIWLFLNKWFKIWDSHLSNCILTWIVWVPRIVWLDFLKVKKAEKLKVCCSLLKLLYLQQ